MDGSPRRLVGLCACISVAYLGFWFGDLLLVSVPW